ncbi:tetratricopeptide repeat protein [Sphingomonas koreensis]|jgi:TPR repeat protein|nr:tetratricopeptide repeat protein [Sphingomonas koreensis]
MNKASAEYMEYLRLYEEGRYAEAESKLNEAVRSKDPLAIHTRGYQAEESDPPQIDEALNYYRTAANLGYEPSIMNLARHYEMRGDARWYLYWLRKAADMGSPDAIQELDRPFPYLVSNAITTLEEDGIIDQAISAFKLAARHGNIDAMNNLANIYDLKITPPRRKLAEKLYKLAILRGSALAAHNLSQHYLDVDDRDNYEKYKNISLRLCSSNNRELH